MGEAKGSSFAPCSALRLASNFTWGKESQARRAAIDISNAADTDYLLAGVDTVMTMNRCSEENNPETKVPQPATASQETGHLCIRQTSENPPIRIHVADTHSGGSRETLKVECIQKILLAIRHLAHLTSDFRQTQQ
jgi:hypothetical protein